LFGPGKDKEKFLIFDHWKNFEWFDEQFKEADTAPSKSLMQQVFEARVRLADAALAAQNPEAFQLAIGLIGKNLAALPERSIAVREKGRDVATVSRPEVLQQFDPVTKNTLLQQIAPLMQWVNISGHEEAYQLDKLVCQLQTEKLKGSSKFDDLKAELIDEV